MLRPPLEGRGDIFEYPSPNLSQSSNTEQFQYYDDRLSVSDDLSQGSWSRPSSGYGSRYQHHQQQQQLPSAKRSLSDNMNQAAAADMSQHPLPPPQRHAGGYYSQSSSSSSQGSHRGQQLQGAWATPGKSGAAVVKSGSLARNMSLGRDLSFASGTSSPMFSLSRHSSTSSLSSGSITPASSGTRTPVTMQPSGQLTLISSSASKLEKMKSLERGAGSQGGRDGRGGGYILKHSASGPPAANMGRRNRAQSQQFQEKDFREVNRTPRRNLSSQNFGQLQSQGLYERPQRPLSDGFGPNSGVQTQAYCDDFQRSNSDSRTRRSNQSSAGKPRSQPTRGRGGRGKGRGRNS